MSEGAYDRVKLARDSKRPTGLDYIHNIFTCFMEFHGDRRYGDDPAIVGGIARLTGTPVTVIAIEKGHTTKERTYRNFRYASAGRIPKSFTSYETGREIWQTDPMFCGYFRCVLWGSAPKNGDRDRRLQKIF